MIILALWTAMALSLILGSVAYGHAQAPATWDGTATLDGVPAPDGTVVSAFVGDATEPSDTTTTSDGGFYLLVVPQPPGENFLGQTVRFTVGGFNAAETSVWVSFGGSMGFNLSASSTPVDLIPPDLNVPADIVVDAESLEGTPITNPEIQAFLQGATASDAKDPNPVVTNDAPQLFPSGRDTLVTFTATDEADNQTAGTATVTVRPVLPDITAPVLTHPGDIVVDAETLEGTPIANPEIQAFLQGASATDERDPNPVVTHDAPELFPSGGDTVVTFTATDEAGNQTTGSATVTVRPFLADITDPILTLPDDIVVESETLEGTPITNPEIQAFLQGATATDEKDTDPVVTHDAPELFPSGRDTVVTFTATDEAGNEGTGTATITVQPFAIEIPEIEVKTEVTLDPETTEIVDVQGEIIELVDAPLTFQQVEERIVLALPVAPDTGVLDKFVDPTTGVTVIGTQFTIPVRDPEDKVVFVFKGELEAAPEGGLAVAEVLRLETAEDVGTVDLTDLDPRVGEVTVVLDAQVVSLAEAPIIKLEVGTDLDEDTQIAFGRLANEKGRQVSGDVGAVLTTETNLENRDALITFKIGLQWVQDVVQQVTPGVFDPNDLELIDDVIFIFRLSDEGEPQLLPATGTGPSDGRYTFTASSPAGFSIFGLLALPPVDRPAIPILSLEPPSSITVEVDTLGGATLENTAIQSFLASATTGQGSAAEVNIIFPDPLPTVFPEGNTLVTFVATDALGNLVTDSATITVASTGPPTLQVPSSLAIDSLEPLPASDPRLQEFLGEARATAVVAGKLAVTNDSPEVFPFGDTVVTFTATDSSGNQAAATVTVTVNQLAPDIRVSGVKVTPGRIFGDGPVTVAVQVENLGTASGTRRLEIRLDDRVLDSVEVTLMPGESQTVEREIGRLDPGTHGVEVAGVEESFVVEQAAPPAAAVEVTPTAVPQPTVPAAPAAAAEVTPTAVLQPDLTAPTSEGDGLSGGALAGIVAGVVVVLAVVAGGIAMLLRRRASPAAEEAPEV